MKFIPFVFFILSINFSAYSQNFKGQWKGSFSENTRENNWAGNDCDYVLEIETNGNKVSGYSYTYFTSGGVNYYTICEITGTIVPASKYVEVRETKRIKTNVPFNIRNCLQIHKLTFYKQKGIESLEGNWIPVPDSEKDCGSGLTKLSRRNLSASYPGYKRSTTAPAIVKKTPNKPAPPVVKKTTPPRAPQKKQTETALAKAEVKKELPIDSNPTALKSIINNPTSQDYKKRSLNLMKTIAVNNRTIRIDLYDNGEIDGDSISLFFNDKLLISNQRLSDKAVSLTLNINEHPDVNELVMYAENLGTIPPNTALMVVTDGKMRYEVRIDSDLKKSGAIHFILKE